MTKESEAIPCGLDDGFAETKVALPGSVFYKESSLARAGQNSEISIHGSAKKIFGYSTEEGDFVAGAIRDADPTAFDEYPFSAMNRVIALHTLRQALKAADIKPGSKIFLCTGLPLKKFYTKSGVNKTLVQQKRENLLKRDVICEDRSILPVIIKHDVISEGVAAWMDIAAQRNENGILVFDRDFVSQRVAVIDIGGRTTDIAVIKDGNLDYDRSKTLEGGMISVKESVGSEIEDQLGLVPTEEMLSRAMDTRKLKAWGKEIDISDLVKKAMTDEMSSIRSKVMRALTNSADIDQIIFAGGTVIEVREHLAGWFENQRVLDDPGSANASGMQKYAERLMKRN